MLARHRKISDRLSLNRLRHRLVAVAELEQRQEASLAQSNCARGSRGKLKYVLPTAVFLPIKKNKNQKLILKSIIRWSPVLRHQSLHSWDLFMVSLWPWIPLSARISWYEKQVLQSVPFVSITIVVSYRFGHWLFIAMRPLYLFFAIRFFHCLANIFGRRLRRSNLMEFK